MLKLLGFRFEPEFVGNLCHQSNAIVFCFSKIEEFEFTADIKVIRDGSLV